ncbi:hypothetical protein ACVIGB_007987 [Bradyrhizobium sp. USDA 4341]
MLRKVTLALATAATLAAAALAPTSASAKPFFWHPYHHHFWSGPGISVGFVDSGCYVTRLVLTPYGYRYRTVNVCY